MKPFLLPVFLFLLLFSGALNAQDSPKSSRKKVLTFKIDDNIDPRMNRRVKLALEEAEKQNVDLVVIEMDTYGGAVNDADDIRTMILEYEKPIHVWINKDAASAGALISIACDSIYMAPGGSIGAATVVMGDTGDAAPDKYQSYMRSMMRSTAEAKGRNPKIAEAMVDEDIEIEGVSEKGSVITFSVSEAIENSFCEGEVDSVEEVIKLQGFEDFEVSTFQVSNVEAIISFFLHPAVSGFLILVIFAGIYFELQTPGVGFPLAAAIVAIILYFIPYYLNGLAENWEIAVFIIGCILLLVEIFVIPGFGVAGILGIICVLTGLTLGMIPNQAFDFTFVPAGELFVALLTVILAAIAAMALIFTLAPKVNQWRVFSSIALATTLDKSAGYTSSVYQASLQGKEGFSHTRLMPSGKVIIDDEIYDAHSRGEFIEQGEKIKVISTEGTSIKVKRIG